MDSVYCHTNWAARDLEGVSLPLLADFQPKGAVADLYGLYLEKAGITDRATVIIDKDGIVRHVSSVSPSGHRNADDLLALCADIDKKYGFDGDAPAMGAPSKPGKLDLYFHHKCAFSRNVLGAIKNMRLEGVVELHDVLADSKEMDALVALAGKKQVPCLVVDGNPMHESKDINRFLYDAFCG